MDGKVVALALVLMGGAFAGCLGSNSNVNPATVVPGEGGIDDVVVVAVIDSGLNPYHWDLGAHLMPQHLNDAADDDLPLDTDPALWLPGFPGPGAFADYAALNVTLAPDNASQDMKELYDGDAEAWSQVRQSKTDDISYRWIPGTKVVGYVTFQGPSVNPVTREETPSNGYAAAAHGMGSASVSVGNIHGSCPECLLVFVNGPSEAANEWVLQQDWIDAQTNSWGFSAGMRDRMYAGSNTELQREAIERGQSVFFSAGNGQANTFTIPNPTLFSSQEGPDWIITVGAIDPADRSSYSGHGKPSDIANVGSAYPRSGGGNVTSEGSFGGTSNATPVTAGLYAKALYELRKQMTGASRIQAGGVIAQGELDCGDAGPDCATDDAIVTVHELRAALFAAAQHTGVGWKTPTPGLPGSVQGIALPTPDTPDIYWPDNQELTFMAQGHGAFVGLLDGADVYASEVDSIVGHATGAWMAEADTELDAWMMADSYCRQSLWGTWDHGYYQGDLPASDRTGHPVRTWLIEDCPTTGTAIVDAERQIG